MLSRHRERSEAIRKLVARLRIASPAARNGGYRRGLAADILLGQRPDGTRRAGPVRKTRLPTHRILPGRRDNCDDKEQRDHTNDEKADTLKHSPRRTEAAPLQDHAAMWAGQGSGAQFLAAFPAIRYRHGCITVSVDRDNACTILTRSEPFPLPAFFPAHPVPIECPAFESAEHDGIGQALRGRQGESHIIGDAVPDEPQALDQRAVPDQFFASATASSWLAPMPNSSAWTF